MKTLSDSKNVPPIEELNHFIIDKNHPCVMAQTVFKQDAVTHYEFDNICNSKNDNIIVDLIQSYLKSYDFRSKKFQTFILSFKEISATSEIEFEDQLWNFLSRLKEYDNKDWDATVSDDPKHPNFSYSLLGKAFYIVGMHPYSSRKARKTSKITLVFNLHHQFELLRKMNAYETVKQRIRKRDKKLQGTINPMLEDFGSNSEARQYSGRAVPQEWECPYKHLV